METTDQKAYVQTEIHQGIGTITFFHPQRNSLPGQILQSLAHAITEAGADAAVKVILLQSAGEKVFCSGASFDELSALTNEKDGQKFFSGFAHVINAMRKCPKLIIGRIQGKCVGGGVGLAAAVDYAIAMEGADVKLSELAVGIGPFVVGPAVERKLGLSAFSQLAIDASMWRNADWARMKGLYAELHPDQAGMDEAIDRLARNLAHMSADAMYEMKKMFWKGTEHWDQLLMDRAAVSGRLILSEQAKGAIAAFKK